MGKVLTTFANVFPGAISRNVDDVVISLPNTSTAAIKFGDLVFLPAMVAPAAFLPVTV